MAECQGQFVTLERFAPGFFVSERELAGQFVSSLRINLRSVVATFSCSMLAEAMMMALECEHAHETHHQTRGTGHPSRQGQRCRDH